ncbi:MAG: ribonuclease Y [Actinomycetota bacterium]|nr:ribonuclease Y [Actinomycetota bacterium]
MEWILTTAVVAAFVLGLLFLSAYRSRSAASAQHRAGAAASAAPTGEITGSAGDERGAVANRAASVGSDRAQGESGESPTSEPGWAEAAAFAESTRRLAESEAASTRALAERESEGIRRSAETEAASLLRSARSDADIAQKSAEAATAQARAQVVEAERAIEAERAEVSAAIAQERRALERRREELDHERAALERLAEEARAASELAVAEAAALTDAQAELDARAEELERRRAEHVAELERVAALSSDDARAELMRTVEARARRDAAILTRTIENEARTQANERARGIVVEAVQRCASEQTSESVVSVMHLPSDEMKGRIIGREGRNIRSFEAVTGVNVVIDDTPEAVLLSCFDPTRREIGRLTLEKLVLDGRIHPHRIEEAYEQSKAEVDALCLRAATDALADVGLHDLDERLLPTLGRLKYRTSYGQNVLGHLVETAHISGVMAAELGLEPTLIKRCAFLHDIGKALTHEVQGSHAIIGAELLRKHGESEAVAHAVEAHHNEVQPRTVEAVLTQAADACSAARPGARRETLESYISRLQRIEEIANARSGVEKVFAMQAGREVRVMVQPETVDDLEAQVIAREIAKQIEDELTYPGQIRVTVVRESRATETAH